MRHLALLIPPALTLVACQTAAPPAPPLPSAASESVRSELAAVSATPGSPAPAAAPQAAAANYGPREGQVEWTLAGAGANDQDFDTGTFNLAGSVGWFLSDRFEVGVRQSLGFADSGTSNQWIGVTRGFADFHFDLGKVYPFVGANFGWVYGDGVDETLAAAPEAGVKWFLQPDAFLLAMAEYQFFFDDTDSVDTGFEDGQFVYTFGFGLNF